MPDATIMPYKNITPKLGNGVFVASGARLIGDLVAGDDVSFWFNTVIRADCNFIRIGEKSNVQDGTTIHVTNQYFPTTVGANVTIGHNVVLHGCVIGDGTLVGMGSIILDGVKVGDNSIVAAGALLPPGKIYPARAMIMGSPAKVVKLLTDEDVAQMGTAVHHYLEYKTNYFSLCVPRNSADHMSD